MKNPKLEQKVIELSPKDACHDYSHTLRVVDLALEIAKAEGGDEEIIYLAALLHDIGRAQIIPGKKHAEVGAEIAREVLQEFGYEPQVIKEVVHAVAAHSKSAKTPCQSLEAMIVYDADKVDALGAIGLARLFVDAGHKDQPFYPYLPNLERRSLCEGLLAEDHEIIDSMYTATGHQLAWERYQFEEIFFHQMEKEVHYQFFTNE